MRDYGDDRGSDRLGPVKIGPWHYDPVHHEINRDAVQNAGKNGPFNHEGEFAASQEKYRRCSKGNQEMECKAERGRGCSAVERRGAEPAGSDSLQEARRFYTLGPPGDEGGGDVHAAA